MKQSDDVEGEAKKVDVIIHGIETIGSAERSCDPAEMKRQFYTISDGGYSDILFSKFSKERVEDELNDFMEHKFFPRSGGGIGVTRMIRAMKLSGLIPEKTSLGSAEKTTQKKCNAVRLRMIEYES